jgi:hypothetical protein
VRAVIATPLAGYPIVNIFIYVVISALQRFTLAVKLDGDHTFLI